jgi:hypothetical protein
VIIVKGVNDPPIAQPFTHTMTEGTGIDILDILALTNASDVDPGDNMLTVSIVSYISGTDPNGKIDFENKNNWVVNSDEYSYLNEGETNTTIFNISIQDKDGGLAPVVTGTIIIEGVGRCEISSIVYEDQARDLIISEGITTRETLENTASYQNRAFRWLVEEDTYPESCPNGDNTECNIIQRYVLATLYFGGNGPEWFRCTATEDFDASWCNSTVGGIYGDQAGSSTWLSDVSECEWGLLACNPKGCIDRIEMGTFDGFSLRMNLF